MWARSAFYNNTIIVRIVYLLDVTITVKSYIFNKNHEILLVSYLFRIKPPAFPGTRSTSSNHLRSLSGNPVKDAAEPGSKHTNYKVTVSPNHTASSLFTTLINHIQLKRNAKLCPIPTRRIFARRFHAAYFWHFLHTYCNVQLISFWYRSKFLCTTIMFC